MDETMIKNELEVLKEYAKKNEYIPLSKITEVFGDVGEEILDEIIKELENEGIEVTKDSEEDYTEEDILIGKGDDEFEAFIDEVEMDEELEELTASVEN